LRWSVPVFESPHLRLLNLTLPTPAENLACDEALLADCAAHGDAALRFWESPVPCVVVGYANAVAREVNLAACAAAGVPVLRRCSGGGTVVLGPGCLNYSLVLPLAFAPELGTVGGTNAFILRRLAAALSALLGEEVASAGDTDLVGFDLGLVARCLPLPSRQPAYRAARPHAEFLVNLPLAADTVKEALRTAWGAEQSTLPWPEEATRRLVRERYAQRAWVEAR
jgi:lipoate-protein ligase A